MRSLEQIADRIATRVRTRWKDGLVGTADTDFPWRVSVGKPTPRELDTRLSDVRDWNRAVMTFAATHGLEVERTSRRSESGLRQTLPSHVVVATFDAAARVVGRYRELVRDRARFQVLQGLADAATTPDQVAGVVSRVRDWSDEDVAVLAAAVDWFAHHSAAGLTPREVPIPGMDSKWLTASRQAEISLLLHRDSLDFAAVRPQKIHYRYTDPTHLESGGRRFDVAVAGDVNRPAYLPSLVVICENVDSAQQLPDRAGTIVFEGDGDSGATLIASLDWVKRCPAVVYWGDMDADGLSIVNTYRDRGLAVRTILMDLEAYVEFEDRGVFRDRHGEVLGVPTRRDLPHLAPRERDLYDLLCDEAHEGPRRIEQEQLPRAAAVALIDAMVDRDRRYAMLETVAADFDDEDDLDTALERARAARGRVADRGRG